MGIGLVSYPSFCAQFFGFVKILHSDLGGCLVRVRPPPPVYANVVVVVSKYLSSVEYTRALSLSIGRSHTRLQYDSGIISLYLTLFSIFGLLRPTTLLF